MNLSADNYAKNPGISEVSQYRVVRKEYLNDQGNLFGGIALQWMDEVAYITARHLTGQTMVTAGLDRVRFLKAIREGSVIRVVGKVTTAGAIRSLISAQVWIEEAERTVLIKAVEGVFTFVAVDKSGRVLRNKSLINKKS